jgi:hypothetical protein
MKSKFLFIITAFTLLSFPKVNFGQAPDLGAASGFALFTAVGAFTNTGATYVTGDIGTNAGAFDFTGGTLVGQIHVLDGTSASAATAVGLAYSYLCGLSCGSTIGTPLGSGQVLTPNVYCLVAASTLTGNLTLNGQGNCNALFIFKIDGAFSTGTNSNVLLINGAQAKNVYWQINGEFSLGGGSVFRGTVVAGGIINLNTGAALYGRALSTAGAINLYAITATITRNLWKGGGNDDWNTASNWIPGVVPSCSLAINAEIQNGATPYPVISSTGNYADNLVIQSGATLTVNPGKDLTVCGCTEMNGSDALILKSDNTGTASFIDNGISGTGTAKVERYLSQNAWHFTCFPITTTQTNPLQGIYVMYYSEPVHHFHYIISLDSTLDQTMLGYGIWSDGNNATVNFSGTLNTGNLSIPVSSTYDASTSDYDGWNLVGNPYPSAVDLSLLTGSWTNVEATAWFWNPVGGNYNVYPTGGGGNHSKYCPPEQGFFVHNNTGSGGTVKMNNGARVHNLETFLKSSVDQANLLRIMASGTINSYNDELSVYFNDSRTKDYEPGYDAWKYSGLAEAPQIYTLVNNKKVSVNALPFSQKNITVPMGFSTSIPGNYTLVATNLGSFDETIKISLEDLKLSTTQDLKLYPSYTFAYDTPDSANRFVLHFNNLSFGIEDKKINNPVQIYSFGSSVYIKSTDGTVLSGDVFISDMIGRELYRGHLVSNMLNRITPVIDEGYYGVKVVTNAGVYSGKIYLEN